MYKITANSSGFVSVLRICSFIIASGIITLNSCKKEENLIPHQTDTFVLTSAAIGPDSLLPLEYTCDGAASTLPLEWSGYPAETKYFALLMYHEASPVDIHWYWIIYNIPSDVNSFQKNATGIGTPGTNSVNGRLQYAPPCSQGPGRKDYMLTVFALSEKVEVTVPPEEVDMEVFLNSIQDITIKSASMTVWYARNVK
jgi:phosphatidylethanolamine-binding protein (PEBP) family uncharacterized protein